MGPQSSKIIASGFWAIVDFEFQGADTMYVLEANPNNIPFIPFSGRLTRVDMTTNTREVVAEASLSVPSGLAIEGDTIYISNNTYNTPTNLKECVGEVISASTAASPAPA